MNNKFRKLGQILATAGILGTVLLFSPNARSETVIITKNGAVVIGTQRSISYPRRNYYNRTGRTYRTGRIYINRRNRRNRNYVVRRQTNPYYYGDSIPYRSSRDRRYGGRSNYYNRRCY